jgi:hypothetical protein
MAAYRRGNGWRAIPAGARRAIANRSLWRRLRYNAHMRRLQPLLFTLMILTATSGCAALAPVTPTAAPVVRPLVTVALSPTPDAIQQTATHGAITPTAPPPTATTVPSATPYIGIFIGEAAAADPSVVISTPLLAESGSNARTRCGVPIMADFLPIWDAETRVAERLGCPIQTDYTFLGEVQLFEHGVMYRQPGIGAIFAIRYPEVGDLGRYFYAENPPPFTTEGITAPAGMLVPDDALGSAWMAVAGLRDALGYAITDMQPNQIAVQRFNNGTALVDRSSGQAFALITDGLFYGPYRSD